MSAKNSVDSVRMEMIADMDFVCPQKEEQIKIGRLLSLIDERIETQNRIIDKLQSLMKGLAEHLIAFAPNLKIECEIETEKAITDSYLQQKRFLLQSIFI